MTFSSTNSSLAVKLGLQLMCLPQVVFTVTNATSSSLCYPNSCMHLTVFIFQVVKNNETIVAGFSQIVIFLTVKCCTNLLKVKSVFSNCLFTSLSDLWLKQSRVLNIYNNLIQITILDCSVLPLIYPGSFYSITQCIYAWFWLKIGSCWDQVCFWGVSERTLQK